MRRSVVISLGCLSTITPGIPVRSLFQVLEVLVTQQHCNDSLPGLGGEILSHRLAGNEWGNGLESLREPIGRGHRSDIDAGST